MPPLRRREMSEGAVDSLVEEEFCKVNGPVWGTREVGVECVFDAGDIASPGFGRLNQRLNDRIVSCKFFQLPLK